VNKHIKISSKARGIGNEIVSSTLKFSSLCNYFYSGYKITFFNNAVINSIMISNFSRGMSTKSYKPVIKPYSEAKLKSLSNKKCR